MEQQRRQDGGTSAGVLKRCSAWSRPGGQRAHVCVRVCVRALPVWVGPALGVVGARCGSQARPAHDRPRGPSAQATRTLRVMASTVNASSRRPCKLHSDFFRS